jgi:hypothetical protein
MMMDFEVQRCTRHCHISGRELQPTETFYSALVSEGANVLRRDYSAEAWQGPPDGALGWWKSQLPSPNSRKLHWAPNDVMIELLDELADQPDKLDMRYVLSLLLVRRRVARLEEMETDEQGREVMVLYCPRNEKTYRVLSMTPSDERAQEIQQELASLLFADAE